MRKNIQPNWSNQLSGHSTKQAHTCMRQSIILFLSDSRKCIFLNLSGVFLGFSRVYFSSRPCSSAAQNKTAARPLVLLSVEQPRPTANPTIHRPLSFTLPLLARHRFCETYIKKYTITVSSEQFKRASKFAMFSHRKRTCSFFSYASSSSIKTVVVSAWRSFEACELGYL